MDEIKNNNSKLMPVALLGLVALVAAGAFFFSQMSKKSGAEVMTKPATNVESMKTAALASYKDGTYNATGNYTSPAGAEDLDVKLTIKGGVVVESEVTPKATNQISAKWQKTFSENYKSMVVGKNINDLKLDKVSGSSLTTKGFNDALEKIKSQSQKV